MRKVAESDVSASFDILRFVIGREPGFKQCLGRTEQKQQPGGAAESRKLTSPGTSAGTGISAGAETRRIEQGFEQKVQKVIIPACLSGNKVEHRLGGGKRCPGERMRSQSC